MLLSFVVYILFLDYCPLFFFKSEFLVLSTHFCILHAELCPGKYFTILEKKQLCCQNVKQPWYLREKEKKTALYLHCLFNDTATNLPTINLEASQQ